MQDLLNTPMIMEKFPDVNVDPMQAIRRQIRTEIDEMYPNNKKKKEEEKQQKEQNSNEKAQEQSHMEKKDHSPA